MLVARYLNMTLPLDSYWTTIPTVGSNILQGAKLKAKGYRAGTPDLVIIYMGIAYWIELKAIHGTLSAVQAHAMNALIKAKSHVWMASTLEHVQEALDLWQIPTRARLPGRQPPAVDAARAGGA